MKSIRKVLTTPSNKRRILNLVAFILRKPNLHFLHIGKTGGTSLKSTLSNYKFSCKYVIHLHGHAVRLKDLPINQKVIFSVRDPLSRFVSGFNSRLRQGRPHYNSPWLPQERVAFSTFKEANELAEALFSENLDLSTKAELAMKSIGHVNTFYWDWFGDPQLLTQRSKDILLVLEQKSLSSDFEKLKSVLKLPYEASLPDSGVASHVTPTAFNQVLTEKAIENLKKWYKEDYEFLNCLTEVIEESRPG